MLDALHEEAESPSQFDLEKSLRNLVTAQRRIRELRAGGMSDAQLREAMVQFGFGWVSLEEFVSAETIEEVVKLLSRNHPPGN